LVRTSIYPYCMFVEHSEEKNGYSRRVVYENVLFFDFLSVH